MAIISQFGKGKSKGITIANLPLPDGTKRVYRARLATPARAIRHIINLWKDDCARVKLAMALRGEAV